MGVFVEWLGGDGEIKISKHQLQSLAEPLRPYDWMSPPRIRTETGRAEKCKKSIDKSYRIDKYLSAAKVGGGSLAPDMAQAGRWVMP